MVAQIAGHSPLYAHHYSGRGCSGRTCVYRAVGRIYGDISEALPSGGFLAIWAGAQMVPLALPLILAEIGNRKRKAAIPPGLCALFVAVFTAGLMMALLAIILSMTKIPNSYRFSSWQFGVLFILGSCAVGGISATALVSPLVRRWAARNASAKDISDHF